MDWKLFAQLVVTAMIALAGGWLGHHLSSRRDLTNERRKMRVSYLLEAYRRLESGSNRREDPSEAWSQIESAIADIQLLGTPEQVRLAKQFAQSLSSANAASADELLFDLRSSLRSELQLAATSIPVTFLRFSDDGAKRFESTLIETIRDVAQAEKEAAATTQLEDAGSMSAAVGEIATSWLGLERKVRERAEAHGIDATNMHGRQLLRAALEGGAITQLQYNSLLGLQTMRNLAVHSPYKEITDKKVREFRALAEAINAVLEMTGSSGSNTGR